MSRSDVTESSRAACNARETRNFYPRFDALTTLCVERVEDSVNNLVDPASSHMLVSEIKPCMSKYIPSNGETANGSLNQLWFLGSYIVHG